MGPYTYTCNSVGEVIGGHEIDSRCVRVEKNMQSKGSEQGQNLNACKMTCGKYGALWPRPTGRVNLSDTLVPVLPNNIVGFSIMQNGENDGMYLNNSENVALYL